MAKMLELSTSYIVCQEEGNIVSDMGGEKVMLSINNGKYYNLGEIGGVIWDLIKEPKSIKQVIGTLLSQYEVEQRDCEVQVMTFIKLLSDEGVIKVEAN